MSAQDEHDSYLFGCGGGATTRHRTRAAELSPFRQHNTISFGAVGSVARCTEQTVRH